MARPAASRSLLAWCAVKRTGRSFWLAAAVLKIWSKRHGDLSRLRCQAARRLRATLCEIIPGGVSMKITTPAATTLLAAL